MYKIAHRGASSHELENTFKAFERAIELGANMIELDVRLSKDHKLVIMHNSSIDKTTNGKGFVKDLTLNELKQFRTLNNESIPTLGEAIELVNGRSGFYIELKEKGCEQKIVDLVQRNRLHDKVIVTSFIHDSLKKIKGLDPNIKTSALFSSTHNDIINIAKNANADFSNPCWECFPNKLELLEKHMSQLKKNGIGIITWHEEEPEAIKGLFKLGVDGVCSNNPELWN